MDSNDTHEIVRLKNGKSKRRRIGFTNWQYYCAHGKQAARCPCCKAEKLQKEQGGGVMERPGSFPSRNGKEPLHGNKAPQKESKVQDISGLPRLISRASSDRLRASGMRMDVRSKGTSRVSCTLRSTRVSVTENIRSRGKSQMSCTMRSSTPPNEATNSASSFVAASQERKTDPNGPLISGTSETHRSTFKSILANYKNKAGGMSGMVGGTPLSSVVTGNNVSELPEVTERDCVPRRVRVRASAVGKWVDPSIEKPGIMRLSILLDRYYSSNLVSDRIELFEWVMNKDPCDFGYNSRIGKYPLIHMLRDSDEYMLRDCLPLCIKWYPMSSHVDGMIKLLGEEGIFSPQSYCSRLREAMLFGILPFEVRSQLTLQLLLCETGAVLERCRHIPLIELFEAPWYQTAILLGHDPSSMIPEPKVLFKHLEDTFSFQEKRNSIVEINAALIQGGFYMKANLRDCHDYQGFRDAADIVKSKGHKGAHFFKLMIGIHQLWTKTRMVEAAGNVPVSQKRQRRGHRSKRN